MIANDELVRVSTVITCHRNADFDATAAVVAASVLYPDSALIFPGTQERQLQRLYDGALRYLYNFRPLREIDLSGVDLLVIVDTWQADRVPHVAELLENEHVAVHTWDHHPEKTNLPRVTFQRTDIIGSTSTLLTEEIARRGLRLDCETATVIGLGIYGDTGSFSYSSTTVRDYQAAAMLRAQGMDVTFVASMMRYELNRDQLRALTELLDTTELHDLGGSILVIATANLDTYLNDFAVLASHFTDYQPCDIFFGLGAMEDKVQVVARSKDTQVDVGAICKELGGGGHASAASAAVRDRTIPEIRDFILNQLSIRANQNKSAEKLMSSPAVGIEASGTMLEAEAIMARYGFKALPVYRSDTRQCEGWLEHQLALRAISHGLGDVSVAAYMQRNFEVATRGDSLQTLMDIIVGQRQRLVPVVEGPDLPGRFDEFTLKAMTRQQQEDLQRETFLLKQQPVIGIVTRTDLIRTFTDDENTQLPKPRRGNHNKRSLKKAMQTRLAPQVMYVLELAGRLGDRLGLNVYVVGGFVRDLLMAQKGRNWPDIDIDLVVEGDALPFASSLAEALRGRVNVHKKFLTAVILYPSSSVNPEARAFIDGDGTVPQAQGTLHAVPQETPLRLDIASARLEYYTSPAALPTVERSSLKMDLYRRDFTINAMAIQLNIEKFGTLQDFFDGQLDIKRKHIRMLHSLSFIEDPTRALRAVRFEQRYGFRIGPQADRLIRNAIELRLMDKLSGKRVVHELVLLLKENEPIACFSRMQEFGMLAAIHPQLDMPPWKRERLEKIMKVITWHKHLYLDEQPDLIFLFFLGICRNSSTQSLHEVMDRLEIPPNRREAMMNLRFRLMDALSSVGNWQKQQGRPSQLHDILRDIPLEGLLYLVARVEDEKLHRELTLYIYEGRKQKPDITGNDLKALGVRPGPVYKYILRKVLDAKLDGLAVSRDEQYALAGMLSLPLSCPDSARVISKKKRRAFRPAAKPVCSEKP